MDQPLRERRVYSRFGQPTISHVRAVLRPGRLVFLVNLSSGGALVEGRRPLRPGSRVYLHLSTDNQCAGRAAHVLRCAVASLTGVDGVRYRGALKFDAGWESLWEEFTQQGYVMPVGKQGETTMPGHMLPTRPGCASAMDEEG